MPAWSARLGSGFTLHTSGLGPGDRFPRFVNSVAVGGGEAEQFHRSPQRFSLPESKSGSGDQAVWFSGCQRARFGSWEWQAATCFHILQAPRSKNCALWGVSTTCDRTNPHLHGPSNIWGNALPAPGYSHRGNTPLGHDFKLGCVAISARCQFENTFPLFPP